MLLPSRHGELLILKLGIAVNKCDHSILVPTAWWWGTGAVLTYAILCYSSAREVATTQHDEVRQTTWSIQDQDPVADGNQEMANQQESVEPLETTEPATDKPTRAIRFNLFQRNQSPVSRAKRPTFQPRDNERIYFSDFYAEALQGSPPDFASMAANNSRGPSTPETNPTSSNDPTPGGKPFDELISAESIEDLVKEQVNLLTTQITTPGRFRSDYSTVHQTYVQLAALFAVNEHYGKKVRWQEEAGKYRAMLGKTAAGTRVGTDQAYQLAVRTRDDLQQILRGERPQVDVPVEPLEDWSVLIYRTSLMIWLEALAQEQLRPLVSDEQSTKANQAEVTQQAEQIAFIAQLLMMPQMDGHNDESYVKHAKEMKDAALAIHAAYTRQDYGDVGVAVNRITQSCDACHEDFR